MLKPKGTKKSKSTPSPCDSKRILQAISILKQLNQKFYEKREKKSLLDDESENPIILQFTLKKIPPPTMQKFIKVHLPKSILADTTEVCLITGDLDKRNTKAEVEPDVLHFKELLKKENISQVNEVITLRQLRREYKPFEARRKLCGAYDVFLCDKRIAGVLPHTLGKCFFKKRRVPIQINMQTPKLREQIENALSSTVFHISCRGNSCASEVANLTMNDEDILSNVKSSIDVLKEQLPGQWDNVLGIYVKTPKSKAIPLYMSNDDPNDFNFAKRRSRPKAVTAELSTFPNAEVKVFRDGRVVVKAPKKMTDDSSTSDEENSLNGTMEQNEEMGFPSAPEIEEVQSDTCAAKEQEKKSKKRKSDLGSIENSRECEVEEEKSENSKIENTGKKSKKRKSKLELTEDSTEAAADKEVEYSKDENSEKKKKKRKSSLSLTEDSSEVAITVECFQAEKPKKKGKSKLELPEDSTEATVDKEVEIPKNDKSEKKLKKRKSTLSLTDDSSKDAIKVECFEAVKPKKKGKNINLNLELDAASLEVEVSSEKIENYEAAKPEKKNRKSKSTAEFNKESTEVANEDKNKGNSKLSQHEIKSNRKSDIVPKRKKAELKTEENIKSLSLKSMKNRRKTIN